MPDFPGKNWAYEPTPPPAFAAITAFSYSNRTVWVRIRIPASRIYLTESSYVGPWRINHVLPGRPDDSR